MKKKVNKVERKTPAKKNNVQNNERFTRIILIVLLVALATYAVITFVTSQSQLAERKQELESINNEIDIQEIKNDEMEKLYNYSGDELSRYIEQIARDELDYVKQGERVFVNVSGD